MASSILNFCRIKFRNLLRPLIIDKTIRFSGVADWFLFSLFVLPTYLGVRAIFFDLTALRLFEILLLIGIFRNKNRQRNFTIMIKKCPNKWFFTIFIFVVIYTNLLRGELNSIFYWITNGILVFTSVSYLIIYEYGIDGFLKKIKAYLWIITTISPVELIIKKPPFSFLDTLGKSSINERFGSTRIMGNCSTTNGYAMFLLILLPLIWYDPEKKRIDMGKNKLLFALIALNVFLTGSRLTVGTLVLAAALCFILQARSVLKRNLMALFIIIPIVCIVVYMNRDIEFFRSILRTFFSAVDEVLGTQYSVLYGAQEGTLYNSTYYRELLWKNTILGDWLNPWLGKGGGYKLNMYIQGYYIRSCDNYYVAQYIAYGIPGVVAWLLMSLSFFVGMIKSIFRKKMLGYTLAVSFVCYFISLWYLDHLQTFPIMMTMFALTFCLNFTDNRR